MRRRFTSLFIPLICLFCASACGSEPRPFPPWPTPVPQSYTPVQAAGWEDCEIRTVCLAVDQTYDLGKTWPGPIPEELYEEQPIQAATQGSLELFGLEVVDAGSACDASLTLGAAFTPLGANYSVGWCWGGARLDLDASLSAPGRPTLTCPTTISIGPADALRSCTAREDAPYVSVWQEALSESMLCLFGSKAHCPMLIQVWNRPLISEHRIDPDAAAVAVPCLVEQLRHPDPWISHNAARSLKWLGPRAKAAVPYLLQIRLDEEEEDVGWASVALKGITGVGWKEDVDDVSPSKWADWTDKEWVEWWNDQDPEDWGF